MARIAAVIGVVTTSYPRFPDDSAGIFVRERVRALVAAGHDVEVIAAGDARAQPESRVVRVPSRGLFYQGGAPEALEAARGLAQVRAWAEAVGFSAALFAQISRRGQRWDAVESHWMLPCGLLVAAALPGLAHRAHAHGGDVHWLSRLPWADAWARALCRGSSELVFASADLRERFRHLAGVAPESLGARCLVEAAPFDASVFRAFSVAEKNAARRALGLSRATVLAAGRLVPIKGYDRLIRAVAGIPADRRPVVIIAGHGPERVALARLACSSSVDLRMPGQLGQAALAEYMAAADLFVHPCRSLATGRSEGMPLAVREALASGLPVIASRSGGLAELTPSASLVLVEPDDLDDLTLAIMRAV